MAIDDWFYSVIASWVGSWLISGCALETLLLMTSPTAHFPISNTLLATALNALYLLASTSWLFCLFFASACWPLIALTCLVQYAFVSSYLRARLRRTLTNVYFYRDKVAMFYLPSMIIDQGLEGMVTVRGLTVNLLDLSLELHGLEVALDLGSGHKISIHSDAISMKLFRSITIDDVYGVHWFDGDAPKTMNDHENNFTEQYHCVDITRLFPDRERQKVQAHHFGDVKPSRSPARFPSVGDVEAEDRYDYIMHQLRITTRLYQSHVRVKVARLAQAADNTDQDNEDVDTRAAICADLRKTRPAMSPPNNSFTLSQLLATFEPLSRLLEKMPVVLRSLLWLTSQLQPIACPAICFSAAGNYLGDSLTEKLFRGRSGKKDKLNELKKEVSHWLSDADLYLDFASISGLVSVPLRTTDLIQAHLRSADIVVTRLDSPRDAEEKDLNLEQDEDTTGRVARLSGFDTSFSIPVCLLPSHSYLAPPRPESSECKDTVSVKYSVRATLPADFSETFLDFAATFSKTFQLVDIEKDEQLDDEERGGGGGGGGGEKGDDEKAEVEVEASEETAEEKAEAEVEVEVEVKDEANAASNPSKTPNPAATSTNPSTPDPSPVKSHHHHFHHFRTKLSQTSPKLASALHLDGQRQSKHHHPILQHPILRHPKSVLQRSVKKSVVEKIDGAWCAKWSSKVLMKLEDAEGDLGYSGVFEVEVGR